MYFGKPTSAFGYYRGNPYYGGEGAGQGPIMAGNGVFSSGQGTAAGSGTGWNPTVLYLFVLVLVEMFVFSFLSRKI